MAYLNKQQYEYRRESAAARNLNNEDIAVQKGMTSDQASLISKLCAIRHEFHCNIDSIVKSSPLAFIPNFSSWINALCTIVKSSFIFFCKGVVSSVV